MSTAGAKKRRHSKRPLEPITLEEILGGAGMPRPDDSSEFVRFLKGPPPPPPEELMKVPVSGHQKT
jgi:hypothetical protein